MIQIDHIRNLVGNHVAPFMYNEDEFIPGTTPVFYAGPYWDSRETEAAINAFLNGQWITAGENVREFEKRFSDKFNVKQSLMVNSGSSANLVLVAAMKRYYQWEDDDEVIVSPVGFPTTVSVLYQNRLKPVFADIEWNTLNFDLQEVENKITPHTRAIFISPVLGNPPDMDRLVRISEKYGVKLLLDNCDSLGSRWNDRYLNEYCTAFSNSFYPAHHISTGEGGMVCTNDMTMMHTMISIAWWGRDCTCVGADNLLPDGSCGKRFGKWLEGYDGIVDHKYVFNNIGYNLKPLDLQGAIGTVQLDKFDEISQRRKAAKSIITDIVLRHIPGVRSAYPLKGADTCWFGTPFVCEPGIKHRLVQHLERHKIQTRNYFAGNILMHPGYKSMGDYRDYPEANKVLDSVFFIGAAPHYKDVVFEYIEKVVKGFKNEI